MDESPAVSFIEGIRDLHRAKQRVACRQRSAAETFGQRLPLEQFHDQVVPVLVRPDIEERADMRMVQCGNRASFRHKTTPIFVAASVFAEELYRNRAIQARVDGTIYGPHSS